MAFSIAVETLNITYKNRQAKRLKQDDEPVRLRQPITATKSK
jgi:hypothetical protein